MAAAATYLDAHPRLVTDPVDRHRVQNLIQDVLRAWRCSHKVESAQGDTRWAVLFSRFPDDGSVDLTALSTLVLNRDFLRDVRVDWSDGAGVTVRIEVARHVVPHGAEDELDDSGWQFVKYRDSEFGEILDETVDERAMPKHWTPMRERLIALAHAIQNQERFMPVRPTKFVNLPVLGQAALDTENMGHVTYDFLRHLSGIADVVAITAMANRTLRVHFEPRTAKPASWPRLGARATARQRVAEDDDDRGNKRSRP